MMIKLMIKSNKIISRMENVAAMTAPNITFFFKNNLVVVVVVVVAFH